MYSKVTFQWYSPLISLQTELMYLMQKSLSAYHVVYQTNEVESLKTTWHYCPEQICPLKQRTEQLCGRLSPLITLQNKQTKAKHLVQNTNPRIRPPCLSNKLSGPLLGGALEWHHLQRAQNTPALGPQQGGLCLQMDAMVTRCDSSSVSFLNTRTQCYLQMKWTWDSVCVRDSEKEMLVCTHKIWRTNIALQFRFLGIPSPPTCLPFLSSIHKRNCSYRCLLNSSHRFHTFCKACKETRDKRQVSERGERQWQVWKGIGSGNGKQWDESTLYRARSQQETNTIWKPESVAVFVLFLWTWDLPQYLVINTMPLEADVQLREERIAMALSTQNAATARIQWARAECRLTINHGSLLHLNSGSTAGWGVRRWRRGLNICIGRV